MIIGVGLDLVDVREFESEVDDKRQQWLARVFTSAEREYCERQSDPYRHFAGTLAAKEAAMKALGTGWTDETDWQTIEVVRRAEKPSVVLHGSAKETNVGRQTNQSFLSITYTKDYAAAVVVLES